MIEILVIFLAILSLPWLVFVFPMLYADKVCKDLFDFNPNPTDYKE